MDFPETNHIKQSQEKFGNNAKLLEEQAKQINWDLLTKTFFKFYSLFLISLFLLIVTVRLANKIF